MKTNKILSSFLLLVAVIFALPYCLSAQEIKIEVHGAPIFPVASLFVSDAGNDIIVSPSEGIPESQSNTRLNIFTDRKGKFEYEVWVRAVNVPDGVTLEVKRDNAGTKPNGGGGPNALSGGTTFLAINDSRASFFTGDEERINIAISFRLKNISVVQPIENQNYQILFEVNFR